MIRRMISAGSIGVIRESEDSLGRSCSSSAHRMRDSLVPVYTRFTGTYKADLHLIFLSFCDSHVPT